MIKSLIQRRQELPVTNIFKINSNIKIKTESIQGHNIYYIDNFYEHPDKVDNFIFDEHTPLWKSAEEPSFNGSHFFDRRLIKKDKRLKEVYLFLSNLCKQKIYDDDYYIITNMIRFNKNIFNDYKNSVWWPHTDAGYNGIIYFNDKCGTNLYSSNTSDDKKHFNEHFMPWRPKNKYKVLKKIKPKYNRLVLFDGLEFPHGMDISNNFYFNKKYRKNQVFFFKG